MSDNDRSCAPAAELDGRGILITGGTGSFGGKMAETLLAHHQPRRLVVFSRDEFKQVEMEQPAPGAGARGAALLHRRRAGPRPAAHGHARYRHRDPRRRAEACADRRVQPDRVHPYQRAGRGERHPGRHRRRGREGHRALDGQGGEPGQPVWRIEARGRQAVHRRQCARRHRGNALLGGALRQCGGLARLGGAALSPSRRGGCRRSSRSPTRA